MSEFISGVLLMGYAVSALFFARFWRETGDRLFLGFTAGFALLAIQRASLAFAHLLPLSPTWYYVVRLLAFLVILAAIVDKNRAR